MIRLQNIIFLFCSIILFSSCSSVITEKLQNRSLITFPDNFEVKQKLVFEENQAYLYIQAPVQYYKLELRAYENESNKTNLIWTSPIEFSDSASHLIHKVKIDLSLNSFALDIRLLNSSNEALYYDLIYANKEESEFTIYLQDSKNQIIFDNYVSSNQTFRIRHQSKETEKLFIRYFPVSFSPAPPPYSKNSGYFDALNAKYEELFETKVNKDLKISEKGLYFIQLDTNSNKGIYLNLFDADFPKMTNVQDLILATRYITKNDEYEKMVNSKELKKSLDEFWLSRNKKENDAKRMISIYYNRIKEANKYFSLAKEGWKSDMGIIYTIFGKPNIVRKYSDKIIWYYTQNEDRNPVEIVFDKEYGQFVLDRSPSLQESWNAEIAKWRLGRVK
jgi:GWxTD domain-containing protein